jgi:hypothetical protein
VFERLKIVSEVEKVGKCTGMPYLQCFQPQSYLFYISKLDNVIYIDMLGVPSWHHKQTLLYILLKLYYIFYSNFIVRNHITAMSVSNFTIVEHYLYCILFFIYIVHTTRFKFKGCTRYANLFLIVHVKAKMNRKL